MLVFYALFVGYLIAYERFKTAAMHIEQSHRLQNAESRRLAEEAAAAAVLHHSVIGLASVPGNMRHHAFATSAAAWPSFGANLHMVRTADADAAAAATPGNGSTQGPEDASSNDKCQHVPTRAAVAADQQSSSSDGMSDALQPHASLPVSSSRPGSPARQLSVPGSDDMPARQQSAAALAPSPPRTWSDVLLLPIVALLRLTMPEVGVADHVSYPKAFAVLLPVSCPLFVVVAKGLALQTRSPLGVDAILYGAMCSAFSSAVIFSIYPRDGRHYGILSGFFTALTFSMSILWMNIAAGEMVRAWKTLGYMYDVSQAMLGVTVLAWTNSFGAPATCRR